MIEIDVQEAQAHLQDYLDKVKSGETVVVRDGCVDKFELKLKTRRQLPPGVKRPIGLGIGEITILDSFYDPLPPDILVYFEGQASDQQTNP